MARNRTAETRKTTETSLTVLDAINALGGATLSELAEYTGLATSTLHTHLQTLAEAEYVIDIDGQYQLGLKLFHFGESARMRDERYRLARQTASELADRVNDEVNFSVEEYGRAIVLFDEASPPYHDEFQVGRYFHMHSSASGKAMLAEFEDERVREIINKWGQPEHTEQTITTLGELFEELETVEQQGYAVNRQEELEGLRAVAMPINEPDGSVFGTLDISGPSYRLPSDAEVADRLRPFVEDLEAKLQSAEKSQ